MTLKNPRYVNYSAPPEPLTSDRRNRKNDLARPAALYYAALGPSHLNTGRDLYRENCAVCHDIDKTQKDTRKIGPSLNHLFKNEKLPMSHGKPNRPYVVVRIKYGGSLMPAFAKRLNQFEIDTLVDYLASK